MFQIILYILLPQNVEMAHISGPYLCGRRWLYAYDYDDSDSDDEKQKLCEIWGCHSIDCDED